MGRRGHGDEIPEAQSTIGGDVSGFAVQAGTVHGGVHVHVAPDREPPRQLPLPVPAFTGRASELGDFERAAARGSEMESADIRIVVLSGAGGVGKSALATHAALRHAPAATDGQLYCDLGAYSAGGPADVGDVLTHFLTALGVPPERVPADTATRSAVYRSVTAGRRHIILLDDAATAAQVRALLPGPGHHLVLATSRHRLAGLRVDGARFLQIGPLSDSDSTALLRRLTDPRPADAALVERAAHLCGGLPIAVVAAAVGVQLGGKCALRWVTADLEKRSARLAALSPDEEVESSVRATFDASYEALPEPAQRLYRRLGWFPGSEVDRSTAAVLLECSPQEARAPLRTLTACSLLRERAPGRYRIHDLLHLHARECADRDEEAPRERIVTLLCGHYAERARAADRLLRSYTTRNRAAATQPSIFADQGDAMDWLLSERSALISLAREAQALGMHNAALVLADGLWLLFLLRHDTDAWRKGRSAALAAARTANDQWQYARLLGRDGLVHGALGELQEAHAALTQAEEIWRELGEKGRLAQTLQRRGIVFLDGGDPAAALDPLTRALDLDSVPGRTNSRAITLTNLGRVYRAQDRYTEAESALEQAIELFRDPFNGLRTATACTELASLIADRDPVRARTALQHARWAAEEAGATREGGIALLALGVFDLRSGDSASARDTLARALSLLYEAGDAQRTAEAQALLDGITECGPPEGPTGPAQPPPDGSGPGPGADPP
ncbi:tetratricopeptide repeat protein [Nocardiopsis coralliicola]